MPTKRDLKELPLEFEIEELAQFLVGRLDDDLGPDEIEELFYKKYEVDLDKFKELVNDLWPLLSIGISPITENAFAGFSDKKNGLWVIKKDIQADFVHSVIHWLGGHEIKQVGKGMERSIEKNGKPEFTITIIKE